MGSSAIGEMNIVLSANAASFSSQIDQAQRKLDQLSGKSRTTSRTMVSDLQATSGGLRLLEGGMTNSLRAAERFLSSLPGVGAAMKAAFPLVGAIAFSAILARLGKEVYDFIEQAEKVPAALKQGFDELGLSSRAANDELEKTDAELQNQIAKLEGKPENHLQEALIDARIAADKLAESLVKDNREVTDLLSRQKISLLGGLVTGKESTANLSGTVNAYNVQMEDLANQRSIALDEGNTALAADLAKQLKDKQAAALAAMAKAVTDATSEQATVKAHGAGAIGMQRNGNLSLALDPAANLYIAHGEQAELLNRQQSQKDEDQVATDSATEKRLQAAKDFAAKQKQLQQQEVQGWREQLGALKASQDMTVLQDAQFWLQRAETVKRGSVAYKDAMDEANKTIAAMRQQNFKARQESDALGGGPAQSTDTEAQAKARTQADAYLRSVGTVTDTSALQEQGKQAVEYIQNLDKGIAIEKQNASALAEDSIAMAVATGQMTQLDAARTRATLHTQEYTDVLEQLALAQANIESNPALTPLERQDQLSALGNQRTQVAGQRSIQVQQDQQAISSQTVAGASMDAIGQMVDAWKDMASSIAKTLTQTVGGFNDDIVKLLTQKQIYPGDIGRAFGGTLEQGAQGLLRTGLQKGESTLLGGFGLGGKRDGSTAQQALWVVMASQPGVPGAAGGALSHIPGVGQVSGGNPVGNFFSSLFTGHPAATSTRTVGTSATQQSAAPLISQAGQAVNTLLQSPQAGVLPSASSVSPDITNLLSSGPALELPGAPSSSDMASLGNSFASLMPGMDQDQLSGGGDSEGNANNAVTTITRAQPSQAGSIVSKLTGMVLGSLFQGHFAGGGDVLANRPAIVGEQGPEVFMPASAGRIIPNHQLGGASTTHQISIDARGSNDPAQTEAAINRAMRQYLPQAVSASVAKTRDNQRRSPGTAR